MRLRKKYSSNVKTCFNELFGYPEEEPEVEIEMISTVYIKEEVLLLKHFDHLWPHAYPNRSKREYISHRQTVEDGTWSNLGGLLEHAIHIQGKLEKENTTGRDYKDISDAKLISVRTSSKGTSYSAPVTNIHRKRGLLRVVCYERKQDKFYYFLIPYSAYKHIPKSSNIEIPFEMDGEPRRINNCDVNWWEFEKVTFQEICQPDLSTQPSISSPAADCDPSSRSHPNSQSATLCIGWNGQLQSLALQDKLPSTPFLISL